MGPLSIVVYKGGDTYLGCFNALLKFDSSACHDRDTRGHTPLSYAISSEYSPIIFKKLLEVDDIDINATDCLGKSLLVLTMECKQKEYFAALLAHKNFDIKYASMAVVECDDGNRVLHLAAELITDTTYLRVLLDRGDLDVNVQNKRGETPLQHAMNVGAFQCVEMLLNERNINFSLTDNMGNTLLHCFAKMHIAKYLDALLAIEDGIQSYANNQNANGDIALHISVIKCDTKSIQKLFTIKDIIISIKSSSEGLTPLELAETRSRMEECAKLLREHIKNKDGFTTPAVRIAYSVSAAHVSVEDIESVG